MELTRFGGHLRTNEEECPDAEKDLPLEYRQRLVELVRAGQSPEMLSREYEPSAKTIREWVERADAIDRGQGGLTEADKDRRIREQEQQLVIEREEKEIRTRPRPALQAGVARESGSDSV